MVKVWDLPVKTDSSLKVTTFFNMWLFALFLQARNWPVGIMGEITMPYDVLHKLWEQYNK